MSNISIVVTGKHLDLAIAGWLHAKKQRSHSAKTEKAYADTLAQFRAVPHFKGLDLDRFDALPQQCYHGMSERQVVTLTAQEFAGWSTRPDKEVKPATQNQRIAIISSFYEYAIRNDFLDYNPVKKVERAKVQQYQSSKALANTAESLAAIDRTTQRGKRDYAILSVLLATGRRLSEVAGLQWRDLYISRQGAVTVNFPNLKGGKEISDKLDSKTSQALLAWLRDFYGEQLTGLASTAPLWVSLMPKSHGNVLSIRSISNISKHYLGTGKVHATRHTWTKNMLDAGALLPLIQKKLGHNSLATTGIYAQALESIENPFAEEIAKRAGIQ